MQSSERIKFLRKNILNMSQEDFSKKISLSRSNYGNIETGKINLTLRVLNDICRAFQVNSEWILHGTEPIFSSTAEADLDPMDAEILQMFSNLSDENKKYLYGYIQRLLEEQHPDH